MSLRPRHALVERVFAMVGECGALLPKLERPRQPNESASAEAERILYFTLVSALEAALVRAIFERTLSALGSRASTTGRRNRDTRDPARSDARRRRLRS